MKKTYKPSTICDFRSNRGVEPKDYKEYLLSKKWSWYRIKILKRDNFQCSECESKENLNVHHLTYRNLGNEQMKDLITLCNKCHKKAHFYDLNKSAKADLFESLKDKYIKKVY